MVQSTNAAEQKSLDDAARAYEGRGYRVVKEPDTTQLPDFLAGFRPDLIAYGDRENIVIEVMSSAILPQSRDIVSLADVVNERPGSRLGTDARRGTSVARQRRTSPRRSLFSVIALIGLGECHQLAWHGNIPAFHCVDRLLPFPTVEGVGG